MSGVYYSPETYGLETVAELDLSEPNYSFDLLVVWKRLSDGQLLYGTDSGCSCPSPFEGVGVGDLAEFSWTAIEAIIAEATDDRWRDSPDASAVAAFKETIRRVSN